LEYSIQPWKIEGPQFGHVWSRTLFSTFWGSRHPLELQKIGGTTKCQKKTIWSTLSYNNLIKDSKKTHNSIFVGTASTSSWHHCVSRHPWLVITDLDLNIEILQIIWRNNLLKDNSGKNYKIFSMLFLVVIFYFRVRGITLQGIVKFKKVWSEFKWKKLKLNIYFQHL